MDSLDQPGNERKAAMRRVLRAGRLQASHGVIANLLTERCTTVEESLAGKKKRARSSMNTSAARRTRCQGRAVRKTSSQSVASECSTPGRAVHFARTLPGSGPAVSIPTLASTTMQPRALAGRGHERLSSRIFSCAGVDRSTRRAVVDLPRPFRNAAHRTLPDDSTHSHFWNHAPRPGPGLVFTRHQCPAGQLHDGRARGTVIGGPSRNHSTKSDFGRFECTPQTLKPCESCSSTTSATSTAC